MAAKWCDFRPRGHLKRIFTVFKWPAGESLGAFVRNTIGGYPVGETLSEYFEFCVVFCSNNVDWRAIDAVFRRGLRVLLGTALQVYLDPDELPFFAHQPVTAYTVEQLLVHRARDPNRLFIPWMEWTLEERLPSMWLTDEGRALARERGRVGHEEDTGKDSGELY